MNRIKELRKAIGLNQEDLANKLGLVRTAISGWETERTNPDPDSLRKLSEIFDCSIDYILGGDQKERPTVEDDGERFIMDVSALSAANRDKVEEYIRLLLLDQENEHS